MTGGFRRLRRFVADLKIFSKRAQISFARLNRTPFVVLCCFTLPYWVITLLLAKTKPFWYDELLTFYISRLPTLADVWRTLLSGAEEQPPLFFISTRAVAAALGHSRHSIRIPEIFGFWIMSHALLFYVRQRSTIAYELIALLRPLHRRTYEY